MKSEKLNFEYGNHVKLEKDQHFAKKTEEKMFPKGEGDERWVDDISPKNTLKKICTYIHQRVQQNTKID
jgi:hypothetical protein